METLHQQHNISYSWPTNAVCCTQASLISCGRLLHHTTLILFVCSTDKSINFESEDH